MGVVLVWGWCVDVYYSFICGRGFFIGGAGGKRGGRVVGGGEVVVCRRDV